MSAISMQPPEPGLRERFHQRSLDHQRPVSIVTMAFTVIAFLCMVAARTQVSGPAAPLAYRLLCALVLALLVLALPRARSPFAFGALGVAYLLVLTGGVVLNAGGVAQPLLWLLPALVVIPICAGPLWLTPAHFITGSVLFYACVIGLLLGIQRTPEVDAAVWTWVVAVGAPASAVFHFGFYRFRRAHFLLESQLAQLAATDPLTGLQNRRAFVKRAEERLAAPAPGGPLSAIFLDIDNFKSLNDRFGHAVGDHALFRVAQVLMDEVGAGQSVSRIGGEEFALLLDADLAGALRIAERVRAGIAGIERPDGLLSASFGVAEHRPGESFMGLLDRADEALLRAKQSGRNRVCAEGAVPVDAAGAVRVPHEGGGRVSGGPGGEAVGTALVDAAAGTARASAAAEASEAVETAEAAEAAEAAGTAVAPRHLWNDFALISHFQPLYSLSHQKQVGFEALLRGERDDGSLVPPATLFAPQPASDEGALDRASHAVHLDNARRALPADAWLFLNILPATFIADGYADRLTQIVRGAGLEPERVVLEILESHGGSVAEMSRAAGRYRQHGFLIAVDDFGAGQSNLDRLLRIRPDLVKLDGELIRATSHGTQRPILPKLVSLLHQAGMLVVVEGVETEAELILAVESNVDFAQGYLLGRPAREIAPPESVHRRIDDAFDVIAQGRAHQHALFESEVEPYRLELRRAATELRAGAAMDAAFATLAAFARCISCFILDGSGRQLGHEVRGPAWCKDTASLQPVANPRDARWDHRPYFRNAVLLPGEPVTSNPYLSLASGRPCIAVTLAEQLGTERCVVGVELDWSARGLPWPARE
ncbi:bifunctional diguanylate cyclase/phosphodiesterase [Paraburkholderia sp. MMS20-SJTR3]|uniref:Bifunctional diguanylate cyclase/phosphodiesterase n=1 Tax=Paraburkholderia sejongensis TaxID=2886946 RepID=A0ABS8JXI8_9BURK|nr:bifunctional diguanylate cyclase/phosphodiesterase [Paraburkholderia sp. MMS20-SJTR3]MCC8394622.1 bifunctional diguanylate cyclase/phosphodiesterase [Paraburkholderia sp. MMS20-SJTR3]